MKKSLNLKTTFVSEIGRKKKYIFKKKKYIGFEKVYKKGIFLKDQTILYLKKCFIIISYASLLLRML